MIDIKIDNKGDFVLEEPKEFFHGCLKWFISPRPVLRLLLKSGHNMSNNTPTSGSFKIQFGINSDSEIKNCRAVIHEEELRQRIMIRLRTELGDIKGNKDYGTILYQQKHLNILSEDVQDSVRRIILDAVSSILTSPNVIVERTKSNGPFFCQNLDVHIFDSKKEIYNFQLEGTL